MARVTIGDDDIEARNEEKVKTKFFTVLLLLVHHGKVSGTAGNAETRGVLCSCCQSAAELEPGCIWFLLETDHNSE